MSNFYGNESTQHRWLKEELTTFTTFRESQRRQEHFAKQMKKWINEIEKEVVLDELVRQSQELGLYEWSDKNE